jgi:hypothetical protein
MNAIAPLWSEALIEESKKFKLPKKIDLTPAECRKDCRCSTYQALLGKKATRTKDEQKDYTSLVRRASMMSAADYQACAKKVKWFCKSALRQRLQSVK